MTGRLSGSPCVVDAGLHNRQKAHQLAGQAKSIYWRRVSCGPDQCGPSCQIWRFYVKPFWKYTTASLCDERWPTDPVILGQNAWRPCGISPINVSTFQNYKTLVTKQIWRRDVSYVTFTILCTINNICSYDKYLRIALHNSTGLKLFTNGNVEGYSPKPMSQCASK